MQLKSIAVAFSGLICLSMGCFSFMGCSGESSEPGGAAESAAQPASKPIEQAEAKPATPAPGKTALKPEAPVAQKAPAGDAARAPDKFAVKLETTKGDVIIDVDRSWAPRGADRFYELVGLGYYSDVAFFRVLSGFMAQTGISGDPGLNAQWKSKRIKDDPGKTPNARGTLSFAMAGPHTRTTQFFINFSDNRRLDPMGFAPFGKVRDMKTVDALYAEYGEGAPRGRGPSQRLMQSRGNVYLKRDFPKLDYIVRASVVEGE